MSKAQRKQKWSEVAQSCPTLCNPMDCSLPGSSIHGIFQSRILESVAISFSRRSSQPRDWTWVSHIVGRRFTVWATKEMTILCPWWLKWMAICFKVGCEHRMWPISWIHSSNPTSTNFFYVSKRSSKFIRKTWERSIQCNPSEIGNTLEILGHFRGKKMLGKSGLPTLVDKWKFRVVQCKATGVILAAPNTSKADLIHYLSFGCFASFLKNREATLSTFFLLQWAKWLACRRCSADVQ